MHPNLTRLFHEVNFRCTHRLQVLFNYYFNPHLHQHTSYDMYSRPPQYQGYSGNYPSGYNSEVARMQNCEYLIRGKL